MNFFSLLIYPSNKKYANMDPVYDYENDSYFFQHDFKLKNFWLFILMLPNAAYIINFLYGFRGIHDNIFMHSFIIILDIYCIFQAFLHLTESVKSFSNSELIISKFFKKSVIKINHITSICYPGENGSFLLKTDEGETFRISSYLVGLPKLLVIIERAHPGIFDGTHKNYLSVSEKA